MPLLRGTFSHPPVQPTVEGLIQLAIGISGLAGVGMANDHAINGMVPGRFPTSRPEGRISETR